MGYTNYAENKVQDAVWRGQSLGAPANMHVALLLSTHGPRANSTTYALNNTISVACSDGKIHLFKCTTAGTSNASQPAGYTGAADQVINDGTAVFTEQTSALDAGTAMVEPSGGAYARVQIASSLANWSGTQGAGTTTASTGTGGEVSNNNSVAFPAPVGANWGFAWGLAYYDASTAGNAWAWGPLGTPKTINDGDSAPTFPAAAAKNVLG